MSSEAVSRLAAPNRTPVAMISRRPGDKITGLAWSRHQSCPALTPKVLGELSAAVPFSPPHLLAAASLPNLTSFNLISLFPPTPSHEST